MITNQNKNVVSTTDDIQSYVTQLKQNYSVQATATTTHLTQLNYTLHIVYIKLNTTTKLPPYDKEYLFLQICKKTVFNTTLVIISSTVLSFINKAVLV